MVEIRGFGTAPVVVGRFYMQSCGPVSRGLQSRKFAKTVSSRTYIVSSRTYNSSNCKFANLQRKFANLQRKFANLQIKQGAAERPCFLTICKFANSVRELTT